MGRLKWKAGGTRGLAGWMGVLTQAEGQEQTVWEEGLASTQPLGQHAHTSPPHQSPLAVGGWGSTAAI